MLNIVTGIGLLRLERGPDSPRALLSAVGLVFLHAPALVAAVANGGWSGIDWLGIVGTLVVLFAVLRRWPAEPVGAD